MRLEARYKATLLVMLFLSLSVASAASAEKLHRQQPDYQKVVSADLSDDGNFLLLKLSQQRPLLPPALQFLCLPDGRTVMTCDFAGLIWNFESRTISSKIKGIEHIRIGQFQASPPVMRIAVTATHSELLRKIELNAKQARLTLKLPGQKVPVASNSKIIAAKTLNPAKSALASKEPKLKAKALQANNMKSAKPESTWSRAQDQTKTKALAPDIKVWKPAPQAVSPSLPRLQPQAQTMALAPAPALASAQTPSPSRKAIPAKAKEEYTSKSIEPPFARGGLFLDIASNSQDSSFSPQSRNSASKTPEVSAQKPGEKNDVIPKFPAPAPEIALLTAGAKMPPAAPQIDSTKLAASAAEKDRQESNASKNESTPTPALPEARIEFSGQAPFQVKMQLGKELAYKSFRLEDPPRYVIDLPVEDSGFEFEALEPEQNPFLKSLRLGKPEGNTSRIVLDLAAANVAVKEGAFAGNKGELLLELSFQEPEKLFAFRGKTVVVDAGHGGSDPGAQRGEIQEKVLTLDIALKLKKELEQKGAKVVMTRSDDSFVSLEERTRITNSVNADAFVSVHINSLETDRDISGIETYYQTQQSRLLAAEVHKALVEKLAVPDRSVRKARFYVVNHTDRPAILAEVGFISNKDERDKLISSEYQNQIAQSLAKGVGSFLKAQARNSENLAGSQLSNPKANPAAQNVLNARTALAKQSKVR